MVFASKNKGKIREVRAILEELDVNLQSLDAYPDAPDVVEDGSSFFENALKKARVISEFTGEIALADDSGLEVDVLNGHPGVYSARFAGEGADDNQNNKKLMELMNGVPAKDRSAAFRCVLVLYHPDGNYESFDGRWDGFIGEKVAGTCGFGYDPVFLLQESGKTVAQLTSEEKNRSSHRAKALHALKDYLRKRSYPAKKTHK
ncbi:MAG: XTP/dITP diphosphatase [Syntrophus sp. (in: bacteria)]|nr:XTP/dITP diphosphatase [Syntrophus sp. (in: bacteria)]